MLGCDVTLNAISKTNSDEIVREACRIIGLARSTNFLAPAVRPDQYKNFDQLFIQIRHLEPDLLMFKLFRIFLNVHSSFTQFSMVLFSNYQTYKTFITNKRLRAM